MDKKTIKLTEGQLCEVIKESITKVITEQPIKSMDKKGKFLLSEMAIRRGDYVQSCINQSKPVLMHIGLICVYESDTIKQQAVNHWKSEIAAQIIDLARVDIKDDPTNRKKMKAFIEGFIEARLGENLSEYDNKMWSYIADGLKKEGLSDDDIRKINLVEIANINKERINKYLYSFVNVIGIPFNPTVREQIITLAHSL